MENKYNKTRYNQYEEGKIQCPFCGGWYHRVCLHTTQRHHITAKQYKKMFGFDNKKGITSPQSHKKSSDQTKLDKNGVISYNLIKQGKKTRLKPNHNKNYIRRPQTIARLKHIPFTP